MGGYLGVQKGSKFPPQFVHLTYRPEQQQPAGDLFKVALVGKGLTFDRLVLGFRYLLCSESMFCGTGGTRRDSCV